MNCSNFTFESDGKLYHFSRNNIDYKHVIRCDKDYNPLPEGIQMTVDDYCVFLDEKYGTEVEAGLKCRGVVAPCIRVLKRDTLDELRSFRAAKDEKAKYAIKKYT